jgi:hypothetical protein
MQEHTEPIAPQNDARSKGRYKGVLVAGLAIAGLSALVAGAWYWEGSRKPDYSQMRAYRMSQLTDADLETLMEEARSDFAKFSAAAESQRAEQEARNYAKQQACTDWKVKARNPEACRPVLQTAPAFSYGRSSVDEVFEMKVMGMCMYAFTTRFARKYDCLPR